MLEFKAAFRYLCKGGAKTVSAVISVSLAVFMMTVIAVIGDSFAESLRNSVISETGNYHIKMFNASEETYGRIKSDVRVSDVCAVTAEAVAEDQLTVYVPEHVSDFFGDNSEKCIRKDLVAVGLTGELKVVPDGMEKGQLLILYVRLKKTSMVQDFLKEYDNGSTITNSYLLDVSDVENGTENTYRKIKRICVLTIAVIMLASVLFISNAYMVSYNEEAKEMGLWTMLGATSSQLTTMTMYKAVIVSFVALICGGSLGCVAAWILIHFGGSRLAALAYMTGKFSICFKPRVAWDIVLLTIAVSVIAAMRPAFHIRRMTAVEGINDTLVPKDYKLKVRETYDGLRRSDVVPKLKNRYNQVYFRKNVSAVATISIAVVAFLSVTFVCNSEITRLEKEWDARGNDIKASVAFDSYAGFENWYNENVKSNSDIKSSYWYVIPGMVMADSENLSVPVNMVWNGIVPIYVMAVDDELFENAVQELWPGSGSIDCIVSGQTTADGTGSDGSAAVRSLFDVENTIKLSLNGSDMELTAKTAKWESVSNRLHLISSSIVMVIPYVKIGQFSFEEEETRGWEVCIRTDKHKVVADELRATVGYDRMSLDDLAENRQSEINTVVTVKFFGYLIVGMIALISISNVMLTVYHGIVVRKKDLIVLQTLGMKYTQMFKMFFLEAVENVTYIFLTSVLIFAAVYLLFLRGEYKFSLGIMFKPLLLTALATVLGYLFSYMLAFLHINRLNSAEQIK